MGFEVGDHEIEHGTRSGYEYTVHHYECVNDGCHIKTSGEHGALDYIKELADEFECPSGPNECMVCEHEIRPTGEICKYCKMDLTVSERVVHNNSFLGE